MKSFDEQNIELVKFDKSFNGDDFNSCVSRAMLLLKNRESQMIEEGYDWNIDTASCRWSIEQAITNRQEGVTMMSAAIKYVEDKESAVELFNNI